MQSPLVVVCLSFHFGEGRSHSWGFSVYGLYKFPQIQKEWVSGGNRWHAKNNLQIANTTLGALLRKSHHTTWLLRQETPRPCDTVHASFHPFPPRSPVITNLPTVDKENMTFKVCLHPQIKISAQISSSRLSVYCRVRSWYGSV